MRDFANGAIIGFYYLIGYLLLSVRINEIKFLTSTIQKRFLVFVLVMCGGAQSQPPLSFEVFLGILVPSVCGGYVIFIIAGKGNMKNFYLSFAVCFVFILTCITIIDDISRLFFLVCIITSLRSIGQ